MTLPVSSYDYFVTPPSNTQTIRHTIDVVMPPDGPLKCHIDVRVDVVAYVKTVAIHVPCSDPTKVSSVVQEIIARLPEFTSLRAGGGNIIIAKSPDILPGTTIHFGNFDLLQLQLELPGNCGVVDLAALGVAKSILLYCDCSALAHPLPAVRRLLQGLGHDLVAFGAEFVAHVAANERPKFFLSYASQNKESLALPLAMALQTRGVRIWFDEYEIKPGDSIRETIELGLKSCERCVLLLTKEYLENRRMAKAEFESIFQREQVEGSNNLFVPIWVGVSREEVFDFCTSLTNRAAVIWAAEKLGQPDETDRVAHAITTVKNTAA